MGSDEYKDQILSKLQQWLAEEKLYHQARINQITIKQQELILTPTDLICLNSNTAGADESKKIMIANGHRLSQEEIAALNDDDFDIILDMINQTLRYRRDPQKNTKLEQSTLQNIGSDRIRILAYMLEHPDWRACDETICILYGNDYIYTPNALTKTISLLRQALGIKGRANPYILGLPAWELSSRKKAFVYKMNPNWRYLVNR